MFGLKSSRCKPLLKIRLNKSSVVELSSRSSDFYAILGVKQDATQREIKAAYYQLSKKYHPDVAGSNKDAARKFLEVSEAYECLRDPDRRRGYDNQTSGGGGRYTGDYRQDPFSGSQYRTYERRYGNPFYSRQFTQQEYDRIWQEFNRLRNERMRADQRVEFERQRIWQEFAQKRAQRWQDFHTKYPNGPPGSNRWEWHFTPRSPDESMNKSWDLFRKIMMTYFICFFVISLVKVVLQSLGDVKNNSFVTNSEQPVVDEREQMKALMDRVPITEKERLAELMKKVPLSQLAPPPIPAQTGVPTYSETSNMPEISQNVSFVPREHTMVPASQEYSVSEPGSEFSVYRPNNTGNSSIQL